MLDEALELLVRGGRDVRHAHGDAASPQAWEGDPRPRPRRARLLPVPLGPARAVGRPGRARLHRRTGGGRDPRPQRPAAAALRSQRGRAVVVRLRGRCHPRAGTEPSPGVAGSVPARCSPSTRAGAGSQENGAINARLARGRPTRRWLAGRVRAGDAGEPVVVHDEDLAPARCLRRHPRGDLGAPAADGHARRTSPPPRWATIPRSRRSPGRARPLSSLLPPALRPGHQPRHRPPARAVGDVACARSSARAAPLLTEAPGRATARARVLLRLPLARILSPRLRSRSPSPRRSTRGRGSGRPASGSAQEAEDAVREGAELLLLTDEDAGGERAVIPALLAVGAVHQRLVAAGLRTRTSIVVSSDEPRETHLFACLLGYGADAICPRLALETIAAMAEADKIGGDRPSPAEAQLRFRDGDRGRRAQGHVQDGHLRPRLVPGGAALRGDRPESRGDRQLLRRDAEPGRRHRVRRARDGGARAARGFAGHVAEAREPGLRQVPQGRRAARDEPGRRRCAPRDGRRARAAQGRERCGLGALRAVRSARQRSAAARAA